jgi:membrane protease YdiL (CAAX protease family)
MDEPQEIQPEEDPQVRPEEVDESLIYSEEYSKEDPKWYGVPAKGEQPIYNRWKYVFLIIFIIVVEIGIWAVYRNLTADLFEGFGTHLFYLVHIIAAPTIHLLPILLFWWYIRRERGLPFVFSKKLLLTGIIVGFSAAIIWRLLEEFLYDGFAGLAGGTVPGTLTFIDLLETADLFILMTFVMYFIVGPVEELEFRSFLQDQGARVLSNWQAVILSSILFGCSHIPIAVFVYQLPPTQFADALFGWIAAGFTFGVLYMYSRNIFACIVMHGMGNWQLSVFYYMSQPAGMSPSTAMMVGMATSFVANAIMIVIFYLINKYYWEPHRRGEAAFGGLLIRVQNFLHEHDFEQRPMFSTVMVFTLFIVIVSGIIMGAAVTTGSRPVWFYGAADVSEDTGGSVSFDNLIDMEETDSGSGQLDEGQTSEIYNLTSTPDKYIKSVTVTVTWTDEADIYVRYENQPDTFMVSVNGMNVTVEDTGTNTQGGEGSVTAELSFANEEIEQFIEDGFENYAVNVELTMLEAGPYRRPVGAIGFTDNGNAYDFEISIVWLTGEE